MWMIFGACAAAVAGPGVGLAVGGGPVSSQVGVRLSNESAGDVTWGVQATLATSGPWLAPAQVFARDLVDGEMLVQPLLGPAIDVAMSDLVFLGFGFGVDLLAPLRAGRDVALLDPENESPVTSWGLVFPASVVANAWAMSQFKVAVGVRPLPPLALEVGVWPSAAMMQGVSVDPLSDLLRAARPGAQMIAHF